MKKLILFLCVLFIALAAGSYGADAKCQGVAPKNTVTVLETPASSAGNASVSRIYKEKSDSIQNAMASIKHFFEELKSFFKKASKIKDAVDSGEKE